MIGTSQLMTNNKISEEKRISKLRLRNKYFFRLATKLRMTPFWPLADHLPAGIFCAAVLCKEVFKLFNYSKINIGKINKRLLGR